MSLACATEYINKKVSEFKEEDGWLYAIYGTPAESLCGLQVEQFRKKYGIVENVSDRPYVSNSLHCHVTEDITPIEKQDLEGRLWELCNGGKIQYVRYPIDYNVQAIKSLIRQKKMDLGYMKERQSFLHTAMTAATRTGDGCLFEMRFQELTKIDCEWISVLQPRAWRYQTERGKKWQRSQNVRVCKN